MPGEEGGEEKEGEKEGEERRRDNRNVYDDNTAQKMSMSEITAMKTEVER